MFFCVCDDGASRLSHVRSGVIQTLASCSWWGGGAAASWWDSAGWHVPDTTEDASAATVWEGGVHTQDGGSALDTEWTDPPGSLRVNMSRPLQRVIQREGYVTSSK